VKPAGFASFRVRAWRPAALRRFPGAGLRWIRFDFIFLIGFGILFVSGCRAPKPLDALPERVLWAWERPEDLRGLNSRRTGAAPLVALIRLDGAGVALQPRLQPLHAPADMPWLAVVRIESRGPGFAEAPVLDGAQRSELVAAILREWRSLSSPAESAPVGLQIDFDATYSERWFYRQFLSELREELPPTQALTMTALASWVLYETWTQELPVDEVCPMYFRMGRDTERVRRDLSGNRGRRALQRFDRGWFAGESAETIPALATGLAADELEWLAESRARANLDGRRVYLFHPRGWTPENAKRVLEKMERLR